jgi:lipopolysaccharide transport system permease protein
MAVKKIISAPDKPIIYLNKVIKNFRIALSLAKSEISGQAAQTWLGYSLNLVQILIATGLYWLIFGIVLKVQTDPIPYPLFLLTGVISWQYFSGLVQQGSNALIQSQHIISKIYFPRTLLPISKTLPGLINFFIAIVLCILLIIIWHLPLRFEMLLVPVFLIILIFSGLAISLFTASISVKFRDLSSLIPHLTTFGFFITPVFFPTSIVPNQLEFIMYINPVALAIEGMRWAMFGSVLPSIWYLISFIPTTILFIWGWNTIRRKEKTYADII